MNPAKQYLMVCLPIFLDDAFLKPSKLLRRIEGSGRLRYNGVEIIYSGTLVEEQNS